MPSDPADPLAIHPATAAIAQTGDHDRRLAALERRSWDPDEWGIPIEASRRIGAAGNPGFESGWSHYTNPGGHGGAETHHVEFYRTVERLVMLQGIATSSGVGATAFFLPSSYRPSVSRYFTNRGTSGVSGPIVTLWIKPDGAVFCNLAAGHILYLDGIVFRV